MADESTRPYGEILISVSRSRLQNTYGAGTYVAIYDQIVLAYGNDPVEVKERAERLVGDEVYVGVIPEDDLPLDPSVDALYEEYGRARKANKDRRRWHPTMDQFMKLDEIGIIGGKTELLGGLIQVDGVERRFADYDYKLAVERGAIPADTELIAGIVFNKKPRSDDES